MALAGYTVGDISHAEGAAFIRSHHYSRSAANTSTYRYGLRNPAGLVVGVALFMPPTQPVAEMVDPINYHMVFALSLLAIAPGEPKNSCSYLLARARKDIRKGGECEWLVTYADTGEGHTGAIYLADGWTYTGDTRGGHIRWVDGDGRHVAAKSTVNRTKAEMLALGYNIAGRYVKRRFVRQP